MAIAEVATGCGDLPVLLLNTDGYYDGTIQQLTRAYDDGLLRKHWSDYVHVVTTPEAAVSWCTQQRRRSEEASGPAAATRAYRRGLAHVAAAAVAVLAVSLLLRRARA
jgi:predicted Rossmann-fold nucleotide-binding protein